MVGYQPPPSLFLTRALHKNHPHLFHTNATNTSTICTKTQQTQSQPHVSESECNLGRKSQSSCNVNQTEVQFNLCTIVEAPPSYHLVSRWVGGADESLRPIQTVAGALFGCLLFGPIFWRRHPFTSILPPPSSSTNYPPTPTPTSQPIQRSGCDS